MIHDPRNREPVAEDQPQPLPQTWKRPDDGKSLPERDVEVPLQDAGHPDEGGQEQSNTPEPHKENPYSPDFKPQRERKPRTDADIDTDGG